MMKKKNKLQYYIHYILCLKYLFNLRKNTQFNR